jgi:hypothetical protein
MKAQFARVQAYSAHKIAGILDEASRVLTACTHVENPRPPTWLIGNREIIEQAVREHMSARAAFTLKSTKTVFRKRRADHRCLVAGVLSSPTAMQTIHDARKRAPGGTEPAEVVELDRWFGDALNWIVQVFGSKLVGVLAHLDEAYPHLHFFAAGDAQRIHPGLRSELVDNRRIENPEARMSAYKRGVKDWLDSYYVHVGLRNGHSRGGGVNLPAWRIRDRSTRRKMLEIDARLEELASSIREIKVARSLDESANIEAALGIKTQLSDLRQALYDDSPKFARPILRF